MFKYTFRFNKKVFYVHQDWYAVTVMSYMEVTGCPRQKLDFCPKREALQQNIFCPITHEY